MIVYMNRVEWRGGHLGHTWCQNGVDMDFSAPPDLFGKPDVLTPEDAFLAAANSCYHMMVVWAMERMRIELVSFKCEAKGEVEEFMDRTSWFKSVTLSPTIVVRGKTGEVVRRALDMAYKYSTICQSLKSEVCINPTIEVL